MPKKILLLLIIACAYPIYYYGKTTVTPNEKETTSNYVNLYKIGQCVEREKEIFKINQILTDSYHLRLFKDNEWHEVNSTPFEQFDNNSQLVTCPVSQLSAGECYQDEDSSEVILKYLGENNNKYIFAPFDTTTLSWQQPPQVFEEAPIFHDISCPALKTNSSETFLVKTLTGLNPGWQIESNSYLFFDEQKYLTIFAIKFYSLKDDMTAVINYRFFDNSFEPLNIGDTVVTEWFQFDRQQYQVDKTLVEYSQWNEKIKTLGIQDLNLPNDLYLERIDNSGVKE